MDIIPGTLVTITVTIIILREVILDIVAILREVTLVTIVLIIEAITDQDHIEIEVTVVPKGAIKLKNLTLQFKLKGFFIKNEISS
jgi:hypothetical protein